MYSREPLTGVMVGAGFFAAFQAEAWARMDGVRIAAVADVQPDRARAFARQWGIPRAYPNLAEMLERERPDFVDVVTRPETHLELARLAAGCGAHVICQKPMAPEWEEAVAMARACEEAGVRLLIHENWRWQPWYREVRRLVDAGFAGRPFHLSFRMRTGDGRGPEPYPDQPYFPQMPRFLLHETAVHFLDTFRFLAGEIREVACRTARVNPAIAGEDAALVTLVFEGGATGLIDANRISGPVPAPLAFGEFRLEGERGLLRVSPDGRLWLTEYGQEERLHPLEVPEVGYKGDSVRATQEHLLACLRTGAPAETEGREYLKTFATVLACYRAAETGAVVSPAEWTA